MQVTNSARTNSVGVRYMARSGQLRRAGKEIFAKLSADPDFKFQSENAKYLFVPVIPRGTRASS